MTIAELREKTVEELNVELLGLQKELLNIRFQRVSQQLENTARIREIRRTIARIKTIRGRPVSLREKSGKGA